MMQGSLNLTDYSKTVNWKKGFALRLGILVLVKICFYRTLSTMSTYSFILEFPEFLLNNVVPERDSRKRWGTPEGEQEGENSGNS